MMYTGSCPHCGKILRGGHGDPMKRIGSPLCSCPHCGNSYLDENMYEWEVLAPESQLYYYFIANSRWALYIFSFIGSFALNHWLFFPVFVFIAMLLCYGWVHTVSYEDIEKSKVRCTSQGYLDMLVQVGYSKMDQRFYDDYKYRQKHDLYESIQAKHPQKKALPPSASSFTPASSSVSKPSAKTVSPHQTTSYSIWMHAHLFVQHFNYPLGRKQFMYIWSVYFYAVTKAIKDQEFIDGVYSYFDTHAIRYVRDPETRTHVVHEMREDYREIRPALNESQIDPTTDTGKALLWNLLLDWISPSSPYSEEAKERFLSDLRMLIRFSHYLYNKSSVSDHTVRYSISDAECTLPETH